MRHDFHRTIAPIMEMDERSVVRCACARTLRVVGVVHGALGAFLGGVCLSACVSNCSLLSLSPFPFSLSLHSLSLSLPSPSLSLSLSLSLAISLYFCVRGCLYRVSRFASLCA